MSITKILLSVVTWVCLGVAWGGTYPVVPVPKHAKHFELRLPANPTTGYQWRLLKYDQKLLMLQSERYEAKKNNMVGRGGEKIYVFKCLKKKRPKDTMILLIYERPWEKQAVEPTKVFVVFTDSALK